ncbi:MAG: hypothetical protein KR126chlam6_00893 [Candidatus Anoxychlamydiales bacterium]|nr:hypothetical protein [Candidatus Anoxychlamydiales bacterium]
MTTKAIAIKEPKSTSKEIGSQTDPIEDVKVYKIKEVIALTLLTYMATFAVFYAIGNENPFLNAFVPTTGYFISTLKMEEVKNLANRVTDTIQSYFSSLTKRSDKPNLEIV